MFRIGILTFVFSIVLTSVGNAQDSPVADQSINGEAVDLATLAQSRESQDKIVENLSDFLVLTFILLMFTNAVICGHWAITTNRNFWGWYLFGLFTGPLAGGFMLDRSARERTGGESQRVGCWGAVAGIGIPFAGWIIWLILLK